MPTFDEVRAALRVDDLDTAVNALSELARGGTARHAQEATLHAARLERLRQRERAGLLTTSDASVERNRLVLDLSDFTRALESDLARAAAAAQRAATPAPTVTEPREAPAISITLKVDLPLGGGRFEALVDALLAAFPTPNSLARLVRFRLDQNLAAIATGTLQDQAFALVEWAEANGRVRDLVEGARSENPRNPKLAAVAATLTAETVGAPATTHTEPPPTAVAAPPRVTAAPVAAPIPAATTWTSQTLLDALQRLLASQFEELLFRLVVPTHYLPPATAPLTERAIALVRVCEQTGRTADLGAALERLGIRPRG